MLKIAKVKSEKEFYKKYPTEEAFMKAHGKAFKKAAMGAKMVNDQLHQLTDFGNPPIAQVGTMIGGNPAADKRNKPFSFTDITKDVNATNAGITRQQYDKNQQQAEDRKNAEIAAAGNKGGGIGDLLNLGVDLMGKFGKGKTGVAGPMQAPTDAAGELGSGVDTMLGGMMGFEHGGKLYRYQDGGMMNIANMIGGAFDKKGGLGSGIVDMFNIGGGSKDIMNVGAKGALGEGGAGFAAGAEAAGLGVLNAAPQILQGFGQMKQQDANIAKANQFAQLSGLTAQAAESQPEFRQRKYVRPEDSLTQPGQMNSPQGVGTNYLAQNGAEIQNTYAPGNLYGALGYEPLNDSNPKQYAHGGYLHKAAFGDYFQDSGQASIGKGVGSAIGTAFFGPLGGQVGGLLGTVAGNALGGADDATKLKGYQDVGAANVDRAAWAQGSNAIRAQNASFMKDGGYTDSEHAWVSNGWQPQVIAKFGDLDVSQVHSFAHQGMDSLRAGGHLKEYTPPSAEAMYTGRSQYAMGGELKTHWGGEAETMSHNPYLPDGGETVMFRGQSHDETDGRGRSGIGVTYGDSPVEVERGEPAVKLQDGGNPGEDNLVVFGNMVIPDYGVKELGDKNAKGKKFKNYVADLSKKESKYNKTIEKATEIVNNSDSSNPFDQLSFNSGKAMLMGSNLKLKDVADKKQTAAMVQNAILDTAREFGVESDGLAKGQIKAIKDASIGRDGKKLKKAQAGFKEAPIKIGPAPQLFPIQPEDVPFDEYGNGQIPYQNAATNAPTYGPFKAPVFATGQQQAIPYLPTNGILNLPGDLPIATVSGSRNSKRISPIAPLAPQSIDPSKFPNIEMAKTEGKKGKGKVDWKSIASAAMSMYPYGRPTNQMPLDPNQLAGEMYALGNNQLEGVQAQTFQPMLDSPYDISLQDQLNAIDSQSRAAIRASGQDPAAQAYIMSQAADQKNKVLGEQFRFNQANKAQIYQANRQALNQAQLQNLGILDKQYERQSTAKSKTKAQTIAALSSISDKIAKNKLENRKLGLYENLYGFRFDDKGRAYNVNAPAQFDMSGSGSGSGYSNSMLPANKRFTIDPVTKKIAGIMTLTKDEMAGGDSALSAASALGLLDDDTTQRNGGKTKKSKNGSIVKAIKNL